MVVTIPEVILAVADCPLASPPRVTMGGNVYPDPPLVMLNLFIVPVVESPAIISAPVPTPDWTILTAGADSYPLPPPFNRIPVIAPFVTVVIVPTAATVGLPPLKLNARVLWRFDRYPDPPADWKGLIDWTMPVIVLLNTSEGL